MQQPVWSGALRLLHWALAASMIGAFATHEMGRVHEILGYIALVCAALRLVWGLLPMPAAGVGRYARFKQFLRGPFATLRYAQSVLVRRERRHIGHNPLGAWMVLALLMTSVVAGISGALSVTDQFWGVAWVQDTHEWFGEAILPLVLLHWTGVAYTSWHQRENLVAAMLHGRKEAAQPGDVD